MTTRWVGWFDSANVAGMTMAMALAAIAAVGWLFLRWSIDAESVRHRRWWCVAALACLATMIPVGWALNASGSRAASMAVLVSVLWWRIEAKVVRPDRGPAMRLCRWMGGLGMLVVMLVGGWWMLSGGTTVTERWLHLDLSTASVTHRLAVWRSALWAIADSPWQGWGKEGFAQISSQWLLEPHVRDRYDGALNVWLTIGAEHGLVVLSGWLAVMWLAVAFTWRMPTTFPWWARLSASFSGMWTIIVGLCSCFQCYQRAWWWWMLITICVTPIVIAIISMIWRAARHQDKGLAQFLRQRVAVAGCLHVGSITIVLAMAYFWRGPERISQSTVEGKSAFTLALRHDHMPPRIALIVDIAAQARQHIDTIGKPLLARGYTVMAVSGLSHPVHVPWDQELLIVCGDTAGQMLPHWQSLFMQDAAHRQPSWSLLAINPEMMHPTTPAIQVQKSVSDSHRQQRSTVLILQASHAPFVDAQATTAWATAVGVPVETIRTSILPSELLVQRACELLARRVQTPMPDSKP